MRRVFGVDMARHAQVNRNPHAAIAPATVGKLAPLLAADFAAIRLLRRMGHLTDAQFDHLMYDKAGGWSATTTELLADGARLRAWRDRALGAYRTRFDPVALLRRADAWNERPRGDL